MVHASAPLARAWFAAPGAALVALIALVGVLTTSVHAAAPSGPAAEKFVAQLADEAINSLSNNQDAAARKALFEQLLSQGFNMDFISLVALGSARRTATPEQLSAYQASFKRFIVGRYASLLDSYQGEQLIINGSVETKRDRLVNSIIRSPNGSPVAAEWRVRNFDGDLKIIDVKFEGVSMVQSQQEEFRSIISSQGIDGLTKILEQRASAQS